MICDMIFFEFTLIAYKLFQSYCSRKMVGVKQNEQYTELVGENYLWSLFHDIMFIIILWTCSSNGALIQIAT